MTGWAPKVDVVEFTGSGGNRLVGVLRLPHGSKQGLVTVHGWGSGRMGPNNLLSDLCSTLACEGIATLCFDLSGRGDSEGSTGTATIDDMITDTIAATKLLAGQGVEKIALFGLCSGGNAAIGAAALGGRVDGIVAVSTLPFVPITDKAAKAKKTRSHLKGYFLKLFRAETWRKLLHGGISPRGIARTLFGGDRAGDKAPGKGLKDTRHALPAKLEGYKGPLVHVYGSADPDTEPAIEWFTEQYRKAGLKAEFVSIESANHNFYSIPWRDQLITTARSVLELQLRG